MLTVDYWTLGGELLLLALLLTGAGEGYLQTAFRLLHVSFRLRWVEHSIVGFYSGWGLLYVFAVVPIPLFSWATLLTLLSLGLLLLALENLRDGNHRARLLEFYGHVRRARLAVLVLMASTVGLLAFEVCVVGGLPAPNTWDGSVQTEFVVLLLREHTAPWTLAPFAPMGVVYPQATAVSLAVGVLLFGWQTGLTPIYLPPLFMSMTVPAGYALGRRLLQRGTTASGQRFGLLCAASFAVLVTWPRFLVVGSYDFLLALPLLLVLLSGALSVPLRGWTWKGTILFALGGGALGAYSLVALQFLLAILLVSLLIQHARSWAQLLAGLARVCLITLISLTFLARSLLGYVLWLGYPDHVMTVVGNGGPWLPTHHARGSDLGILIGYTDPFLFRSSDVWLSPFPVLRGVLAILLAIGLFLLLNSWFDWHPAAGVLVPRELVQSLGLSMFTGLLMLGISSAFPGYLSAAPFQLVPSNADEISILLFMFYSMVALLPIRWAVEFLCASTGSHRDSMRAIDLQATSSHWRTRKPIARMSSSLVTILAAITLTVPFALGVSVTVGQAPAYLGELGRDLGNVSVGDYAALAWLGKHLPTCSGVLVAPGSAGQFLPAYSDARLIFPMNPAPANLSYYRAVDALTSGFMNVTTRADLSALKVTEVMVTGRSNTLWMPFQPGPLSASSQFELVYQNQDAYVFLFVWEASALGCAPSP